MTTRYRQLYLTAFKLRFSLVFKNGFKHISYLLPGHQYRKTAVLGSALYDDLLIKYGVFSNQ